MLANLMWDYLGTDDVFLWMVKSDSCVIALIKPVMDVDMFELFDRPTP